GRRRRFGLPERSALLPRPDHFKSLQRLGLAFQGDRAERAAVERFTDQAVRFLTDSHLSGRSGLLQPGGDVDRVPDDAVILALTPAAGHARAGINADARGRGPGGRAVQAGPQPLQAVLHAYRRPDGPLGVVFVRDRRAEDREDGVADEFFDEAVVTPDLFGEG